MWGRDVYDEVATFSAIGICFSMADIYRSEILAVVMQQIVDEPVLPTLFLRTVSLNRRPVVLGPPFTRVFLP